MKENSAECKPTVGGKLLSEVVTEQMRLVATFGRRVHKKKLRKKEYLISFVVYMCNITHERIF